MKELNNNMTYEEAYAALRETVNALEDPNLEIEDSLALYERACRLVIFCQRKLGEIKMKVTDINTRMKQLRESGEELF
jgi:exodeoxyribonuclease VII small subunit